MEAVPGKFPIPRGRINRQKKLSPKQSFSRFIAPRAARRAGHFGGGMRRKREKEGGISLLFVRFYQMLLSFLQGGGFR